MSSEDVVAAGVSYGDSISADGAGDEKWVNPVKSGEWVTKKGLSRLRTNLDIVSEQFVGSPSASGFRATDGVRHAKVDEQSQH